MGDVIDFQDFLIYLNSIKQVTEIDLVLDKNSKDEFRSRSNEIYRDQLVLYRRVILHLQKIFEGKRYTPENIKDTFWELHNMDLDILTKIDLHIRGERNYEPKDYTEDDLFNI